MADSGHTLATLPKTWRLTSILPPDPTFPTPADSHKTPRDQIRPRQVRDGLFTWVRPETHKDPELLAVSPAALRDLNIDAVEASTDAFKQFAVGNTLLGWDENDQTREGGGYPWAQLYGGFQFGQWAGQLGDGRAISLFETTAPRTKDLITGTTPTKYEVQLKGAGLTPYSRFADGKAVLRSSIREFVVSEALHALGIPTTRALALSRLPHSKVLREDGFEPGAIVVRFAQSWVRLGNFDILRARGERALTRTLATYVGEEVFGGWDRLPGRLSDPEKPADIADLEAPPRGVVGKLDVQGPNDAAENRFARLYREVVRRNATTVAKWQAYGFMNGVLNTDNTSIYGLSIDFGPFAFMDNFDPSYTPNHDDHLLRYSYKNQPTIIWWNLVRFGEALGELIGAGEAVDAEHFVTEGVREGAETDELVARAEKLITQAGEEYKAVFLGEYKRLMTARLGLRTFQEDDFKELFSELLDTMEALELDFNHFFRRLSSVATAALVTEEGRIEQARVFFHKEGLSVTAVSETDALKRVAEWLDKWRLRIVQDWGGGDGEAEGENEPRQSVESAQEEERMTAMKKVNPSFIPRSFILDELIKRVEKEGDRDVLRRVMHMALHPFEDTWHGKEFEGSIYEGDPEEEARWIADVPKLERAMQCSCSS